MFKYFTNTQFREADKFLTQYTFLQSSMKFSKTGFSIIRYALQRTQKKKSLSFFKQCFKVLAQSKKKPNQMIKVLFFIHLILQNDEKKSNDMLELFIHQLEEIIQNCHQYCDEKYELSRGIQINNGKNKDAKNCHDRQNIYCESAKQNRAVCTSPVVNNFSQNQQNEEPTQAVNISGYMNKNYQITSPKQVMCQKLIQPYCLYLLKKCAVLNMCEQTSDQNVPLWTQINMFKLIFNICEINTILPRYYRKKYLETVLNLIQVLNADIHKIYERLTRKTRQKINQVIKKISLKSSKMKNKKQQSDKIFKRDKSSQKQIAKSQSQIDVQISQAKQLLKQIGQINDKMLYIYWDKYVSNDLFVRNISLPPLMKVQTAQFEEIFQIIHQEEKKVQRVRKYSNQKINDKKLRNLKDFSEGKSFHRTNFNDSLSKKNHPPKCPKISNNINKLGSPKTYHTNCSTLGTQKKIQQFI